MPENAKPTKSGRHSRLARIAALLLAAAVLVVGGFEARTHMGQGVFLSHFAPPSAPIATATGPVAGETAPAGFSKLVKNVKPAVVNVSTTERVRSSERFDIPTLPPGSPFSDLFRQFFGEGAMPPKDRQGAKVIQTLGSGFIIDPTGYVVTNEHVIDGADKITITLDDGSQYPAAVRGRDEKTDLALLKIGAGRALPYVLFGDSGTAEIGDWVVAVGNPFGLGGTVTAGIISARGRDINAGPYDDFIQIDAPINRGNSGGPLFDQHGTVIGVNTAIYSPNGGSVGIGFAIPSNAVLKVIADLRDHGVVARGWVGVRMQPLTDTLALALGRPNTDGVLIDNVEPDSPAAHAKMRQGDIVVTMNGKPVKTVRDFARDVASAPQGSDATVTVWRDGRTYDLAVKVGTPPANESVAGNSGPKDVDKDRPLGIVLTPLTRELRQELDVGQHVQGAVVARVRSDSPAAASGLRAGDVIEGVGSEPVATPSDVVDKVRSAETEGKKAVALFIVRNQRSYYLALQIGKS